MNGRCTDQFDLNKQEINENEKIKTFVICFISTLYNYDCCIYFYSISQCAGQWNC